MRLLSLIILAAAVLAGAPVSAQEPAPEAPPVAKQDAAPPDAPARFTFNRVDGGFLRLDSASGQVALCGQREAGWVCQAVPEERAAFESEVSRLQNEVAGLKTEIAALKAPPAPPRPPADLSPRVEGDARAGLKLPTDDDIKWAREKIQTIWRQFVDMVADMQKDLGKKS